MKSVVNGGAAKTLALNLFRALMREREAFRHADKKGPERETPTISERSKKVKQGVLLFFAKDVKIESTS